MNSLTRWSIYTVFVGREEVFITCLKEVFEDHKSQRFILSKEHTVFARLWRYQPSFCSMSLHIYNRSWLFPFQPSRLSMKVQKHTCLPIWEKFLWS